MVGRGPWPADRDQGFVARQIARLMQSVKLSDGGQDSGDMTLSLMRAVL